MSLGIITENDAALLFNDRYLITIPQIRSIHTGSLSTSLLYNLGHLYVTGGNQYGQLGLGDTTDRNIFTKVNINNIKKVACGRNHTIILLDDNTLWSAGSNDYGQLGLGGDNSWEALRGSFKPNFTQITNLPSGNIKEIACGNRHTLLLLEDGSLWACGDGSCLGGGGYAVSTTFIQVNITNVKQISCNGMQSFVILEDNTLWCFGNSNFGVFGTDYTYAYFTITQLTDIPIGMIGRVICGENCTFILMEDSRLYGTGFNQAGQLGLGDLNDRTTFTQVTNLPSGNIKDVVACNYHSLILMNDNTIWSVGSNDYGALGLGDTTQRTTFTQVTNLPSGNIKEISGNSGYRSDFYFNDNSFILLDDGSLYGCGRNAVGELGIGDNISRNTFTQIPLPI